MKVSSIAILILATTTTADAFIVPKKNSISSQNVLFASTETDDFASFAASLEEDAKKQQSKTNNNNKSSFGSTAAAASTDKSWQADLEKLLDPLTPVSQRQILLSNLMNANDDIRASVQTALRDRKIDPLLTPTGRKLQDGTRAVARQLATDIIPSLVQSRPVSAGPSTPFPQPPPFFPNPKDFSKLGNRLLNTVSNQLQRNLETLQQDIANPTRIPERINKQTEEILQEASNIFSDTPANLKEPTYTVVKVCKDYEIRDYDAYTVATTPLSNTDNPTDQGMAFNTLASYIFGNNADQRVMEMTTPVTTTMSGEMRFYVDDNAPDPLKEDESVTGYDQQKIRIEQIPAARLAVRRFTGFATPGEITRQKQALLSAIALDSDQVELDVPHGQTLGHVVFQYNPPYTLPILRRNEIAVPVALVEDVEESTLSEKDEVPTMKEDPWGTNTNGEISS